MQQSEGGLTAVQRWNRYIQGVMIRDAGNAFLKYYDEIMAGNLPEIYLITRHRICDPDDCEVK